MVVPLKFMKEPQLNFLEVLAVITHPFIFHASYCGHRDKKSQDLGLSCIKINIIKDSDFRLRICSNFSGITT